MHALIISTGHFAQFFTPHAMPYQDHVMSTYGRLFKLNGYFGVSATHQPAWPHKLIEAGFTGSDTRYLGCEGFV